MNMAQQMAKTGVHDASLKPHLRSMTRYMLTVPNLMDYVRIIIYLAAVHGHFAGWWWAMPATIIVNGVIDDFDGKVARALGQTSTMGYLVDCIADNLAVVTNTGCIAAAAFSSRSISPHATWAICAAMQFYALFFITWSALATAVPNYKTNHYTPWARWYYGTAAGDAILYLGMQVFWCALYLYVDGTYGELGHICTLLTAPVFVVKFAIEVENVCMLALEVKNADVLKHIEASKAA